MLNIKNEVKWKIILLFLMLIYLLKEKCKKNEA